MICLFQGWYHLINKHAAAAAKSLQSCLALCDPIDGSPWGCPTPGILQTRTLEWVAISFSNVWKRKVKVKLFSRVWLLATPWTAAHQAPPSMGFSRQEYWSGVPSGAKKEKKKDSKYWETKSVATCGSCLTALARTWISHLIYLWGLKLSHLSITQAWGETQLLLGRISQSLIVL